MEVGGVLLGDAAVEQFAVGVEAQQHVGQGAEGGFMTFLAFSEGVFGEDFVGDVLVAAEDFFYVAGGVAVYGAPPYADGADGAVAADDAVLKDAGPLDGIVGDDFPHHRGVVGVDEFPDIGFGGHEATFPGHGGAVDGVELVAEVEQAFLVVKFPRRQAGEFGGGGELFAAGAEFLLHELVFGDVLVDAADFLAVPGAAAAVYDGPYPDDADRPVPADDAVLDDMRPLAPSRAGAYLPDILPVVGVDEFPDIGFGGHEAAFPGHGGAVDGIESVVEFEQSGVEAEFPRTERGQFGFAFPGVLRPMIQSVSSSRRVTGCG